MNFLYELNDEVNMKILKEVEVIEKIGLSHTTLYRLMKLNQFPRPLRLSANRVGWSLQSLEKWIQERQDNLSRQGGA